MTDLLDLAERCERATGPDRFLDNDVAVAVWMLKPGKSDKDEGVWEWRHPNGRHIMAAHPGSPLGPMQDYGGAGEWGGFTGWGLFEVPPFTASIDAAMTLVPEGWRWQLRNDDSPCGQLWRPGDEYCITAIAASPALALCAAALRARTGGEGDA